MKSITLAILVVSATALAGCASNEGSSGTTVSLAGSGSTFIAPLMDNWRTSFGGENPDVKVSYGGGGSGKGRTEITQNLVDFAGSDAPMKDAELQNAPDVLHIPVAAGAVVIAYNLPGVETKLKFDSATIAGIFLGKITKWNDPALILLNPGVALPNAEIAVVHRSDGSGTTATFTDYLTKTNADWKAGPGAGSSVNWPTGTGANGNAGVGKQIQDIPNTIGYIGSEWSAISKIQTGLVKNKAGEFMDASPAAASAAIDAGLKTGAFDDRLRGSITDMDGAGVYPIAAVTWVLVHQHQSDATKGKALTDFLWFILHEGQAANEGLHYAKMPASIVAKAETFVTSMDAAGTPLR